MSSLIDKIPESMGLQLNGEQAIQAGVRCHDCNRKEVVYLITLPHGELFPAGAYCYEDLLKRCRAGHLIPTPMPELIFDRLKADLLTKCPKCQGRGALQAGTYRYQCPQCHGRGEILKA